MRFRLCGLFLCIVLLLPACSTNRTLPPPKPVSLDWAYTDLRLLDPADSSQPSTDLIAAYTRLGGSDLDLRLDLLDIGETPDQDLYIALDTVPGGTNRLPIQAKTTLPWDILLVIPANGNLQVLKSGSGDQPFTRQPHPALRVIRDPSLDTISIGLKRPSLQSGGYPLEYLPNMRLEVISTLAGSKTPVDRLGPFSLTDPSPAPAQMMLAFWNDLPAYTSLQALRRWDGAHTGPHGGRHGLYNLLRTAKAAGVPLFLLDLTQPASVSALDALGGIKMVQSMENSDLLGLPVSMPGFPEWLNIPGLLQPPAWVQATMIHEVQQIAQGFNLKIDSDAFVPSGLSALPDLEKIFSSTGRHIVFVPYQHSPDEMGKNPFPLSQPEVWKNWLVVPIYGYAAQSAPESIEQATLDGPGLDLRRGLIASAIASSNLPISQTPILIIGGNLPESDWGDPQSARATLSYLKKHPWVKFISPSDLDRLQPVQSLEPNLPVSLARNPSQNPIPSGDQAFLEILNQTKATELGAAAWQSYQSAFSPVYPGADALPELRLIYLRQARFLLEAARWAANPQPISTCNVDPDQDGKPECVLASGQVFSAFELDHGGYLAYLFIVDQAGRPHQVVAPSGLLTSGSSPADTWDLSQGVFADPQIYPGAFYNPDTPPETTAQAQIGLDSIRLSAGGNEPVKEFNLLPNGIEVHFTGVSEEAGYQTSLPVILDPWARFQQGWSDQYQSKLNGVNWKWGITAGPQIEVRSNSSFTVNTFVDQLQLLYQSEDPNREVQEGFRLPFPMALANFDLSNATQDFSTTIRLVK